MLLILASHADRAVSAGLDHGRGAGARAEVVTCHDLAQPGWRLDLDDEPTLVVAGERLAAGRVDGVLTRLAGVTPFELPFVVEADRAYAAAELHAFLVALLDRMPCPVLNRATPGSLCGPAWPHEQWVRAARRAGIAAPPATRRAYAGGAVADPGPPRRTLQVVHVVAGDAHGAAAGDDHRIAALTLAEAAGVDLLRVHFTDDATPTFLHADAWVDVADPAIAEAVRRRFSS
jgi:hypothetical protein